MIVIDIKELTKTFGKTRALNGINLSVNTGGIYPEAKWNDFNLAQPENAGIFQKATDKK